MFEEECRISPVKQYGKEMLDIIDLRDMANESKRKNKSRIDSSFSQQDQTKTQFQPEDPNPVCPVVYPLTTSTQNIRLPNDMDMYTITELSEKTDLTKARQSMMMGMQSIESLPNRRLNLK